MNLPPAHSNVDMDRSKAVWVAPELVPLDVSLDAIRNDPAIALDASLLGSIS
jgi:hypothetical protein